MAYGYGYGGSSVVQTTIHLSSENLVCTIPTNFNNFKTDYDVKDSNNKSSMFLQHENFYQLHIRNKRGATGRVWIHRVEIWMGTSNILEELSLMYVENFNKEGKVKVLNTDYVVRNLDFSKAEHTDGTQNYFKKAGTVRFYFKLKWEDKDGNIYHQWFNASLSASYGTAKSMTVYDKVLQNISVSGQTTSFYKNSTFSLGSGIVKATYKYPVDGSLYEESVFSNYTTSPYIGAVLVNQSSATISFKNKSVTYPITVYGVKEYTKPTLKTNWKLNEAVSSVSNSTITYDDNTTESVPVTIYGADTSTEGNKTVTYKATATKTGEHLEWYSGIVVYDVTHITINAGSCTKNFNANTPFSSSGLVVTAHYGEHDEAGTQTLQASQYTVTPPDMTTPGKDKVVSVKFRDLPVQTYQINVNGLIELDVNVTNCAQYDSATGGLRVAKGQPLVTTGATAQTVSLINGERQAPATWTGTISDDRQTSIDTNVGGAQTITFSVTDNGVTVSCTKQVFVYEAVSLRLQNAPEKLIIHEGNTIALALGNLQVFETTSDGIETALTYGANIEGFNLSPAVGTELTEGKHTVRVISTSGISTSFELIVIGYKPISNATLNVKGELNKHVYTQGETVDLNGIKVTASEMTNGDKNVEVPFNAIISDFNSLTIPSDAESGWYDLEITVDGVTNGHTIVSAILVDGVDRIENLASTKTYKSGEIFDKSKVTGKVVYLSRAERDITPEDIVTEVEDVHYGEDEEVEMTVAGIEKTLEIVIKKVTALTLTLKSGKSNHYNYGDAFDRTRYAATLTYSDSSTEVIDMSLLEYDEDLDETSLLSTTSDAVVEPTLSYTEDDYTVSTDLSLMVKRISAVTLLDSELNNVSKIEFDYGDNIDLTDYIQKVEFNDESYATQYIYGNNIVLKKNDANIIGNKVIDKIQGATVSATCGTETISASLTIHVHYLKSISVSFNGLSSLYAYDLLDLSNVTATKTYSSTDTGDEEAQDCTSALTFLFNGVNFTAGSTYLPNAGTYTLIAMFSDGRQTLTQSTSLTVAAIELQSISIATPATKLFNSYIYHEHLDLTGLTITISYSKASVNRTVSFTDPNISIIDSSYNAISKTQLLDNSHNSEELYAQYSEGTVSKRVSLGQLTVGALELSSIEIVHNPTKMQYTYGDVFSLDGMVIKANYNNGESAVLDLNNLDLTGSDVTVIGHTFNPTDDGTTFGNLGFVFSYTEGGITKNTSTFYNSGHISLVAPEIDYLKTNADDPQAPVRRSYKNTETYSENGLVVTAVMKNGWEKVLDSFVSDAATVLSIDGNGKIQIGNSYGFKTITLSGTNPYNESDIKAVTYDVEIITNGAVVSAILQLVDDYNSYIVGDTFTAKGVSMLVTDIDGEQWTSTSFNIKPAIGTVFRKAQKITVEINYTNGEFTKTETFDITVNVPNSTDINETNNYQLAIGKLNGDLFTEITHEEATIKLGKVYDDYDNLIGEFYPLFHEDKISIDDNPLHTDTVGFNVYTGTDAEHDCIGYIDLGNGSVRNAHVVLFDDPVNPIDGDSNIEVLFPHYVPSYADKINKCKFGVVYNKRLFVSGNEDLKNIDFHTSETNNEINEFTYFSDLDYCKYGSDSKAVVGYAVYRDGDLLVFKEGSKQEATIYRRETKIAQAMDYAGNIVGEDLGEETYPCFPVNNAGGTGAISSKAICNFFGETLAVTEEGVKAITSKDNVFNNSKYTFDVSTNINPRIRNESLDYSFIYPYQECVFLRTNRGIYVGYHDIRNDNDEYEWYFINNISADIFFELDKQLYFANNNGGIYRFNRNKKVFVDKKRVFVGVGGTTLAIDESNNKVIVSGTYDKNIVEGNTFHVIADLDDLTALPTTQIHASLGKFINVNTRTNRMGQAGFDQTLYVGLIEPDNDTIEIKPYNADGTINQSKLDSQRLRLYEGLPVYLDQIEGHGLKVKVNTLYYLSTFDSDRYNLVDEFGNVMELAGVETMRISYNIGENKLTKIHNVSDYLSTGKQFELLGDHNEVLDLIYYNDKDDCQYKGVITIPQNIEAYYVTPPYVFGSALNMKTVWSVAVTNDTGMASEMEIGYLSSHKQSDYGLTIATSSGSKSWEFNSEFTFEKVQFVNDGLPHTYQRYKTISKVGFMRFLFRNNEKSNLIVSSLSVIYSISLFTKGER